MRPAEYFTFPEIGALRFPGGGQLSTPCLCIMSSAIASSIIRGLSNVFWAETRVGSGRNKCRVSVDLDRIAGRVAAKNYPTSHPLRPNYFTREGTS